MRSQTKLKALGMAWLALVLATVFVLSPMGNVQAAASAAGISGLKVANQATAAIVVDGNLNEADWQVTTGVSNNTMAGGTSNNTVKYDTVWDAVYLYVAIQVTDDVIVNNNHDLALYEDDSVEIFIDGDNAKLTSYDANDYQIFIRAADNKVVAKKANADSTLGESIQSAVQPTSDGYTVEVKIPWTAVDVTPRDGLKVGLDVANNDNDTNDGSAGRAATLTWNAKGNTNWGNPSTFGTVMLNAGKNDPIYSPEGTPTVDGNVQDNVWQLDNNMNAGNNTITFGSLTDTDYLYLAFLVQDDQLYRDSEAVIQDDDSLEIFIDVNNDKAGSFDANDRHLKIGYGDETVVEGSNRTIAGVVGKSTAVDGGWAVEVAIPWVTLDLNAVNRMTVGIDFTLNDDDNGGGRDGAYTWSGDGNNWNHTSKYGHLVVDNANITKPAYNGPKETFTDNATDLTKLFAKSAAIKTGSWFNVGTQTVEPPPVFVKEARIYADKAPDSYVIYKTPDDGDMLSFRIEELAQDKAWYQLYVSPDNVTYTKLAPGVQYHVTQTVAPNGNATGWYGKYEYVAPSLPEGTQYLKIMFTNGHWIGPAEDRWDDFKTLLETVSFDYKLVETGPANVAPVSLTAIHQYGVMDTALTGYVKGKDEDGDTLTYSISIPPKNGTAVIADEHTDEWTYTPNEGYVGFDIFEVAVSDGEFVSKTKVTVLSNYAPTRVTYYVDGNNGDDSNTGLSEAQAFKTIQAAADLTKPGDTVYMMNGTYLESEEHNQGVVIIDRSGLPGAYITYKAYPGHKPKLHVKTSWNHILITASFIKVEGLEIEGNSNNITLEDAQATYERLASGNVTWGKETSAFSTNGIGIRPVNQNAPFFDKIVPTHVEIRNNHVHDVPGGGIFTDQADYIIIENNLVHHTANRSAFANSGISAFHAMDTGDYEADGGYQMIMRNNIAHHNETKVMWYIHKRWSDGNGIIVDDFLNSQIKSHFPNGIAIPYTGRTLIENNLSYENGASGVHSYNSNNIDIFHNTAYGNNTTPDLDWGQIYAQTSTNARVMNNILVATDPRKRVNDNDRNTNTVYDCNIYYGGSSTGVKVQGPNDILADPMFVDAANGDFRLKEGSPAIDAANNSVAAAKDIVGIVRPQGTGPDIGAYEYKAATDEEEEEPGGTDDGPTGPIGSIGGGTGGPSSGSETVKDGTVAVQGKLDADGTLRGAVSSDELGKAIASAAAAKQRVVLAVAGPSGGADAEAVRVTFPSADWKEAAKEGLAGLIVRSPLADVLLAPSALADAEGDIEVVIEKADRSKLREEARSQIGQRPVYDITITANGVPMTRFDERKAIQVTIPYKLAPGENPNGIVVYYVDGNGQLSSVNNAVYEASTSTVTFATQHLSVYAIAYAEQTLTDLDSAAWARNAVESLAAKDVINGFPDGSFAPNANVSRAQFLNMVVKALNLQNQDAEAEFTDVTLNDWHYNIVATARTLGIVSGYADGSFRPNQAITREEMAVMMSRAAQLAGYEWSSVQSGTVFADQTDISPYASEAVAELAEAGIITGYEDDSFRPSGHATRAQAAQMLFKLLRL